MDEEAKKLFKCNYCDKSFGLASYRSRHVKRIHKQLSNDGDVVQQTKISCELCKKEFGYKGSLKRHMDTVHFPEETFSCDLCHYKSVRKFDLRTHIFKTHNSTKRSSVVKNFKCAYCTSSFSTKNHLRRHEKDMHQIQRFVSIKICRKCPLCPFSSSTVRKHEINDHLKNMHDFNMECEQLNFQSMGEFNDWKNNLELKENSLFVKAKFSTKLSLHYLCHRSGKFKSSGTNKRRLKTTGSCKINAHCPCEIVAKLSKDGTVSVTYLPTHVGHRNELKFLRLRPEDRRQLAAKLISKTPRDEILKGVRMSVVSNSELKRIHLLNSKDLSNIKRSYNIIKESGKQPENEEYDLQIDDAEDNISGDSSTTLQLSQQDTTNGLEAKKQQIMDKFKKILEKVTTEEQLKFLETKLKEIDHTLEAMASSAE